MTEPKLLTEAEVRELLTRPDSEAEAWIEVLRERGLIAPEPVDPLRLLAVQIVDYLNPQGDEKDGQWIVNHIRQSGMELAERPTLTREMVQEAHENALRLCEPGKLIDHLHAALQERLK
jgi:hypothetical protein